MKYPVGTTVKVISSDRLYYGDIGVVAGQGQVGNCTIVAHNHDGLETNVWYADHELDIIHDVHELIEHQKDEATGSEVPHYYWGLNKLFQVFDVAEEFLLNFNKGNALKYLLRAGKKDGNPELKDLIKCRNCINREISRLQKEDK